MKDNRKQKDSKKGKKKWCGWCDKAMFINIEQCDEKRVFGKMNADAALEVYPEEGYMQIVVQGFHDDGMPSDEHALSIRTKYCPNCGRKLL